MASSINSDNGVVSGSSGLKSAADATGVLELQTNGTAALSISTAQVVSTTNGATIQGLTVGRGAGAVATNTAVGASALVANTTGLQHTVVGASAGVSITTNGYLSAVGYQAAYYMTDSNDAFGRQALFGQSGATGYYNVGVGFRSGYSMTSGNFNTAIGNQALNSNTTASNNTAVGYQAGYTNTTNGANAFFGGLSGYNSTGVTNTYIGYGAGYSMTSGGKNVIIGGYNGNQDGLDIRTASNYIVLSDGDGLRHITTANNQTLALDSAVPNSGTGITFPATQSASTDANTLDDYEEGSFTATLTCTTSGTITLSSNTLYYTKIGRQVSITGYLEVSSVSSPVGYVRLNGLPFTVANLSIQRVPLNISADGLNATAATALTGVLEENQTRGQLNKFSAGTVSGLAGDVKAGAWFAVSATYFTS